MILGLANAMAIGLEADDPSVRATAADILAAMGSLARSATPALRGRLDDHDPQVGMRVAAALILAGDDSDQVTTTLKEAVTAVGEDVPGYITQVLKSAAASARD